MKVIVTIPAYNEAKTIGPVIQDIIKVMDSNKYDYEVLVVDDGSKDGTAEVAKSAGARVVSHSRNRGLASAFRTEIENCLKLGADIIVHTDADGQYLAKEIPGLIKELEKGHDLVLGSRFMGKIEKMAWLKRFGNKAFSRVISNITRFRITDGQTGFRAFTKEFADKVRIQSTHTYTQEQIIRALKENYRVKEIPAYFARRGGDGKSRLMRGPLDYAVKAWVNIFRVYRDYEPLKFFGLIGGAFLGLGILVGIWLVYLFITTGFIGRTPTIILCMLLISVGVQISLFGFLADIFRK